MANVNVQRFYSDIINRGRRNAPTYAEVRRDAVGLANTTPSIEAYRF
ncbi:MAG: hypothetical protein WD942_11440 [Dehalococcoidia bacterium]